MLGPYRDAGYIVPELLVDAVPPGGLAAATMDRAAAPPTRLLADGDVIDLGDRAFEVLHLPGHSPGSIGLWEAASGVLFSGDAVYDGPLLDELDDSDVDDYCATMRRLRDLPVGRRPRRPRAELRRCPPRRAVRRLSRPARLRTGEGEELGDVDEPEHPSHRGRDDAPSLVDEHLG